MDDIPKYTADEIANMRGLISTLYLSDDYSMQMSAYEHTHINEIMLQTYMSQGITHNDLLILFREKIASEQKQKD